MPNLFDMSKNIKYLYQLYFQREAYGRVVRFPAGGHMSSQRKMLLEGTHHLGITCSLYTKNLDILGPVDMVGNTARLLFPQPLTDCSTKALSMLISCQMHLCHKDLRTSATDMLYFMLLLL